MNTYNFDWTEIRSTSYSSLYCVSLIFVKSWTVKKFLWNSPKNWIIQRRTFSWWQEKPFIRWIHDQIRKVRMKINVIMTNFFLRKCVADIRINWNSMHASSQNILVIKRHKNYFTMIWNCIKIYGRCISDLKQIES